MALRKNKFSEIPKKNERRVLANNIGFDEVSLVGMTGELRTTFD